MSTEHQDRSEPKQSSVLCPVGELDCPIAAEVEELRGRLNELSELVRTDPLTGLANYRYFVDTCEREIERTQRSEQPTSLIMLDIDHFKRVNDQWGHENGNQALKFIADILRQSVRRLDIPCRYGGEEFAIILPDTSLSDSVPVAERIRRQIAAAPLLLDEGELQLTASLGISVYTNAGRTTPEELVKQADQYLYLAKQEGRNRVCHAELPIIDVVSREERDALSSLFGHGSKNEEEDR
jgi:diguanylate cyclase (GGDEF)-like protein